MIKALIMKWLVVGRAGRIRGTPLPSNVIQLRPNEGTVVFNSPYLSILRRVGPLPVTDDSQCSDGATLIAVQKLDGAMMHLNEDFIERVENASGGQSAVYLRYGGHMILAENPVTVVEMIRAEKTALLRRVFNRPEDEVETSSALAITRQITQLNQVHGL